MIIFIQYDQRMFAQCFVYKALIYYCLHETPIPCLSICTHTSTLSLITEYVSYTTFFSCSHYYRFILQFSMKCPLLEGRQNRPIYSYGNSLAHKSRHHFKWVERVNFVKIYYLYCLEKSVTMGKMSWIA